MPLRAGFAEIDISPPMGTLKIGWIMKIVIDSVADPIFARVAVFRNDSDTLAFIQMDLLCIRWTEVSEIRRRIEERYGIPGSAVMVSVTHNHAGPAVLGLGDVPMDREYVAALLDKVMIAFGEAMERLEPAYLGVGTAYEYRISHNRRMVMRDGTVQTHSGYGSPNALWVEGPIDPEVNVVEAKNAQGETLGALVNFACHTTHHGGDTILSAGFPGVMAAEMKRQGCPVPMFLNGAAGNLSPGDPATGRTDDMGEMGRILAQDALLTLQYLEYQNDFPLRSRARSFPLPFREPTEDQIRGTAHGAQRFIDSALYDKSMPALVEKIRERGTQMAEVQVLEIGNYAFVAVPGELFVQLGMRIKEAAHPRRAFVVAFTNGYIGYVPHREAFDRGGYETTFGVGSRLAPEAGDLLTDAAIRLMNETHVPA